MSKIRIILNEKNIQISQLNTISSGFYVHLDTVSFPSEQWIDLSASVLGMWLSEINKHLVGVQPDSILSFMDGDYEIRLHRIDNLCSVASFVEPNGNISYSANIVSLQLARQVLSASSKLINTLPEDTKISSVTNIKELSSNLRSTVHKLTKSRDNFR